MSEENSDDFTTQNYLIGFHNRDTVWLLRGTDWIYVKSVLVMGRAIAYVVTYKLITTEARVFSRQSPREIWGGQNNTGTDFF